MYSNTMYSCKFGNSHSDPFSAKLVVKQEDSLNPILFNTFIDDISSCFNNLPEIEPVNLGTQKFNHLQICTQILCWWPDFNFWKTIWAPTLPECLRSILRRMESQYKHQENSNNDIFKKPEALKSLYRSPGYKKNQLVPCKNYVLQW